MYANKMEKKDLKEIRCKISSDFEQKLI
jgi:hypothetical protein